MAVNSFNAQNPPVTTKGDVFTFSTIPTRLGVGANNTVLTADSSTATGLKWAAATTSFVGCSLWKSGNQTISNNVDTNITFNNEEVDTHGFHSTTTDTDRITIPAGYAGKYLLVSQMYFNANNTGIRRSEFLKNGGYFARGTMVQAATGNALFLSVTAFADLAVSDYVTCSVRQSSGGDLDVTGGQENIRFAAIYLGA